MDEERGVPYLPGLALYEEREGEKGAWRRERGGARGVSRKKRRKRP
jgi:hypothetical protein